MDADLLVHIVVLTAAYAVVDALLRRGGLARLPGWTGSLVAAGLSVALATPGGWETLPHGESLRWLGAGLTSLLAWKAATIDIDIVHGDEARLERPALVLAAALSWWTPGALWLALALMCAPLRMWEHHATLPMRMLQALLAWLTLAQGFACDVRALVWFWVVMVAVHYWITALTKAWLGPRPWSWALDNQLHHLPASAWSWGWANQVPWRRWRHFVAAVAALERPLQAVVLLLEAAAPLALLDWRLAWVSALAWAGFHLGVLALSGLFFWEWIAADLLLAVVLWQLGPEVLDGTFGWASLLTGLVFMALFPLRHRLYGPMPLGWWDTPFTQRMHWEVEGDSGRVYGLYNDFMSPHERLYGKVHGCFLAPRAVCTYHLGEVWRHELRDALRAAGPDLAQLEAVRERFGISVSDEELARRHRGYLQAFFTSLGRGERKHVVPRWLRAPGGQLYRGTLPPFQGQEPARIVRIRYREEYFADGALHRLVDEVIETVSLDVAPADPPPREPTPRELDDLLLRHALGRLLVVPRAAEAVVRGDDGALR